MKKFFVSIMLLSFLISCGGGTTKFVDRWGNKCNKKPKWLKKYLSKSKLPHKKKTIYQIGFAMPDTYPERSLNAARKDARVLLSKTLETKIQVDEEAVNLYVKNSSASGDEIDRTYVRKRLIKEKATRMVKNSKVEAEFFDNCNLTGKGEGAHFVLASMPAP